MPTESDLSCTFATLRPRDAIESSLHGEYDAFMSELNDDTFIDMYLKDGLVTIDVYQSPSNQLQLTRQFPPSRHAEEFFLQEKRAAEELEATRCFN